VETETGEVIVVEIKREREEGGREKEMRRERREERKKIK